MTGIIGKAIRGAAAVAVPAAMEAQKAEITKMRDERLNQYETTARKDSQAYQTGERKAGEDFARSENTANRALDQAKINQAERGLDMQESQASKMLEKIDLDIQSGKMGLEGEKQLKTVRDQIANAKTPEELQSASDMYRALQGESSGDSYEGVTLYGDPDPSNYGEQPRTSGILNKRTGIINSASGQGSTGNAASTQSGPKMINTQAEYDALPSGAIYIDPDDGKQYWKP